MREFKLKTPLKEENVLGLQVGDAIYVSGEIFTARDQAHRRFLDCAKEKIVLPVNLDGAIIYHAGPIVKKRGEGWEVVASGPTTSSRMNSVTPEVLKNYKIRMLIGKGGMSPEVVEALKRYGAVYCHFTGGAALLAAKNIKMVKGVEWLDLGVPEALWILQVEEFGPLIVAIDAHGNSLYEQISKRVEANLVRIHQHISKPR